MEKLKDVNHEQAGLISKLENDLAQTIGGSADTRGDTNTTHNNICGSQGSTTNGSVIIDVDDTANSALAQLLVCNFFYVFWVMFWLIYYYLFIMLICLP